jgi:hypothetical protein
MILSFLRTIAVREGTDHRWHPGEWTVIETIILAWSGSAEPAHFMGSELAQIATHASS